MATSTIQQVMNTSGINYCKMPDGTLICWGNVTITNVAANSTGATTVTFPISFISTPKIVVSVGTGSPLQRFASFGNESATGFTFYIGVVSASTAMGGHYIAIGRWK